MFYRRVLTGLLAFLAVGILLAPLQLQSTGLAQKLKDAPPPPRLKQKPQEPPKVVDPTDVVSIETAEVLLPVTVRDAGGQLVANLTQKDFRVFEDGVAQPLSDLSLRQVPVDVVLMVDASSSVAESFDDFRRAAEGFAGYLADD